MSASPQEEHLPVGVLQPPSQLQDLQQHLTPCPIKGAAPSPESSPGGHQPALRPPLAWNIFSLQQSTRKENDDDFFCVFLGFSFYFFLSLFLFSLLYFFFFFFLAVLVSRWQQQTLCFDELINISPGSWELRHALLRCVLPLPRTLCRAGGIFFFPASKTRCLTFQPPPLLAGLNSLPGAADAPVLPARL